MSPAARDPGEVDLLLDLVRHRYGARLTAEQLAALRQGIEAIAQLATAVRAVPLRNGDEPLAPFTPFRADGA
jgi:hypothetical protein